MKRCSYCGKGYPDEATECIFDHQPLSSSPLEPEPPAVTPQAEEKTVTVEVYANREIAEIAFAKLEAYGISCWLNIDDAGGMYPNLALAGGVRLQVRATDVEAAAALLKAQLSASEISELDVKAAAALPPNETSKIRFAPIQIIFGLLAGIILCSVCQQIRKPAARTNYVYTPDGKRLEAWIYQNNHLVEMTKDRNLDGKWDEWAYYSHGWIIRMEIDNNFDGKPDEWITYSNAVPVSAEKDSDFNGISDEFCTYKDGVIQQVDIRPNESKFVTEREIFKNGVLTEILRGGDSNGVFKEDVQYDPFFNPISTNAYGMRWISPPAK